MGGKEPGEVLSPAESQALERGQALKRYVRSAAALNGLFDDTALGEAVGRTRITVGQWWRGARPEPDAIARIADVTGLSTDELTRFVYFDGRPPTIEGLAGEAQVLHPDLDAAERKHENPSSRPRRRRGDG